jgi:hypothetical protein
MPALAGDYFVFVFLASLGVVQIAAAYAGLRGLLFLRGRCSSALLGVGLLALGFTWFFAPGPRLIPDTQGGLNGNVQALVFTLAAGSALLFTLLVTSVVNARPRPPHVTPAVGRGAVREAPYLQTLGRSLALWWRGSKTWTRT